MAGGFPNKGKAPLYPRAISPPPSSRRQRVSVPVHQARWHREYRVPLPYPDVTLPHGRHLDSERIPVLAVPWSARVHVEEVSRRPRLLTTEQRRDPAYAAESPNWELWRCWQLRVVTDEDQEAEAAYQATLVAVLCDNEEEARRRADEEATYQQQLVEAIALTAVGDCVVPPLL
ncbi:hypothetical protein D1007_11929 [Hordeum vulgare]|nr:hypothetical protein D1007_11929 [Hordeum vulgare]